MCRNVINLHKHQSGSHDVIFTIPKWSCQLGVCVRCYQQLQLHTGAVVA